MLAPPEPATFPQGNPRCLVLIQSYTGNQEVIYLPIVDTEDPKIFIATLKQTYKAHISRTSRLFYRCFLFQKVVVSIAEIGSLPSAGETPVLVTRRAPDAVLTDGLRKMNFPCGTGHVDFWTQYSDCVVVGADHGDFPKAAVLIHLEDDLVAAKVFRILGSTVSLAAAIAINFAL